MLIIAIATAVLASTVPAVASKTPASPVVKTIEISPSQRVCLVREITGSMLPLRTCKTLAEWRARGVAPLPQR